MSGTRDVDKKHDVRKVAAQYLDYLKTEVAKVEEFIAMADELSRPVNYSDAHLDFTLDLVRPRTASALLSTRTKLTERKDGPGPTITSPTALPTGCARMAFRLCGAWPEGR